MIDKRDVFAFLELIRDMYGNCFIDYINRLIDILERDSGKIWSEALKKKCLDKKISLEEIWEEILKSPVNSDDPYGINN